MRSARSSSLWIIPTQFFCTIHCGATSSPPINACSVPAVFASNTPSISRTYCSTQPPGRRRESTRRSAPVKHAPRQPIHHCPSQSVILRRALVGRVALRTGCLRLRPRTTYGTRGPGEAGDLVACSPMNFEFAEFCASVTGAENQTMRLLPLQGKKSLSLPRAAPSLAPGNAWPGRKYPCGFWASHRQIPSHESCVNQRTSLIRRQIGLANRRADGVFRIDKITQSYFPALTQHHVRVPLVESVIRRHPTH